MTRVALYVTFAATAVFGVLTLVPAVRSAAPIVFGSETRSDYLTRTLPIYPAQEWINNNTPPKATVALFGDTRGFYLRRPYVWADWGHNKRFTRDFASVDEFVGYLKSQGISYAMVNFSNMPSPPKATRTYRLIYQAIDTGRFVPVYYSEGSTTAVFEVE